MEYYAAVSQILPVLYLAIIVEYRWLRRSSDLDPDSSLLVQVAYIAKWAFIWASAVAFAAAEAAALRGILDGRTSQSTDQLIILSLGLAGLFLVYPLVLPSTHSKVPMKAWFMGSALAFLAFLAFRWLLLWFVN